MSSWIRVLSWQWVLCNSVKLWAVLCRATHQGWVMVESSDKMWSTGGFCCLCYVVSAVSDSVWPHGWQHSRLPCPWQERWSGLPFPSPGHWRREWQAASVFLPLKPHEQHEKAKRHRKMSPPGWKVSNMLLGKSGGQLLTAPERMKSLGQSGDCPCVWWWKSNAVKTNIA